MRAGDRVAIWSKSGTCKLVDGPKRILLVGKTVSPCQNFFASESQYLEVRKKAGPIEIIHGPCSIFEDPVLDASVMVRDATMVDASEALVVYQHAEDGVPVDRLGDNKATSSTADGGVRTHRLMSTELKGSAGGVQRRVVRGPARFIPAANEWVHEFAWSGKRAFWIDPAYGSACLRAALEHLRLVLRANTGRPCSSSPNLRLRLRRHAKGRLQDELPAQGPQVHPAQDHPDDGVP